MEGEGAGALFVLLVSLFVLFCFMFRWILVFCFVFPHIVSH